MSAIETELMEIIEVGFGSGGPMARTVVSNIINHLYRKGWMAPSDAAILVEAAGGEIRISEALKLKNPLPLQWYTNDMTGETILKVIQPDRLIKEAKVNPNAEYRAAS